MIDRRYDFGNTITLTIEAPWMPMLPGQFLMIGRPGYGEAPISVSGSDSGNLALTISAQGIATREITAAERGHWLGIRGPYGEPWPLSAGAGGDLIVMAGGLGLAPLRMALLEAMSGNFRRVILLYGTRDPARVLFSGELREWGARDGVDVEVTVDAADASWRGNVGLVTTLLARQEIDTANTMAFVCGPELMMRFSARALADRGVPEERIFVSLERHMACGTGICGRCQLGPVILCRDGPVLPFARVARSLSIPEL